MEKGKDFTVERIRVFVTENPGKGEAIISVPTPQGMMPLIAVDEKQYAQFSQIAQQVVNETGRKVWVADFSVREAGEVFEKELVQVPKFNAVGAIGSTGKIGPGLKH